MNHMPTMNRRAFVIGTAAAGAGLALGLDIPFGPTVAWCAPPTARLKSTPGW
jgi:isoquinoline 1-oxidoreductase beta subunit